MIAHVAGKVVEKNENALIIDVNGIGYEVQVAAGEFEAASLDTNVKLYTVDHLRENSHELFGFSHLSSKRLFQMLISVSGVGPRMALAILSLGDAESIRSAIALGDHAFVQRAAGVGKRLAERVVVDLKDKVGAPSKTATIVPGSTSLGGDDALDALLALGYGLQDANQALAGVNAGGDVANRVKQALKILGR